MKKSPFFLAFALLAFLFVACSDSTPAASEGAEADAPAAEAPAAEAPAQVERTKNQDDPADRMLSKYTSMGIELSEEQVANLRTIVAKYDFNSAADKAARQTMRGNMQKEIQENVFTPEQRATFETMRQKK